MVKSIKSKSQKNLILAALILIFILVGVLVFTKSGILNDHLPSQRPSQSTKTFESKNLNFIINIPSGFQVKDENSRIIIVSDDGQIVINRNGTQFDNLPDYISDFDTKRNLKSSNKSNLLIDGKEAMSRLAQFEDQNHSQKSYYIYVDNAVYIISTSSGALYDDLDQIAKSFKYTGK